jgi:hypothetical protein
VANTYTPGLKLRQPAQGDDYWDDDLNANAAILEATLGRNAGITGVIGATLVVSEDSGLTVSYTAGSCRVEGTLRTITSGTKVCTDNALNFIYVNSTGAVTVATSLPTPPYAALALVETSGGAIARIGDLRRRIVDGLAEHTEAGAHGQITPSRVTPSGTDGPYRRSATSSYKDPESQVNNVVIKNDTIPLWSLSGKGNAYENTLTASALGSGYVPADANAIIIKVAARDTTNGACSRWYFYPEGTTSGYIQDAAVAQVLNPATSNGINFHYQLTVRLSSGGRFTLKVSTPYAATCASYACLVGWIEPA